MPAFSREARAVQSAISLPHFADDAGAMQRLVDCVNVHGKGPHIVRYAADFTHGELYGQ